MQTYEISSAIFKRDTTGKIRIWWWETGTDGVRWAWRANSGIKDGKIVTSEWKFVDEKNVGRANATTPETQAVNEAHAEYVKKLDRGYFEKLDAVDEFDKFKPMLAHGVEDYPLDFDKSVYYSQPKLDGIRCVARRDGLWSRAGKPIIAVPHIEQYLRVFFEKYPDAVLDGELYNHELKDDFNKITSMVRKSKPTKADVAESAELVQYHVYDCIIPGNNRALFDDRYAFMWDQGFSDPVHYVPTRVVSTHEAIDELYGNYLESGYEGQMIRMNAPYENKRSKYLLKRKEFLTDEFAVVSVEEGKGNWSGYIKRFILRLPSGEEFGAGVRGNQAVLRELFESGKAPDWATLRYFTPTPDGVPRFPVVVDWGYGRRED